MTSELMSKAAYARHRGVGKSAVSNWVTREQIVIVDGKVDVKASDALLDASVDPGRGRPTTAPAPRPASKRSAKPAAKAPDTAPNAVAAERAQALQEQRIGQALKNAQLAGSLVPVAAYEAKMQTLITGFCERMGAEFRSLAERLALASDPRVIRTLLDETMHTVRSDFAARIGTEEADEE